MLRVTIAYVQNTRSYKLAHLISALIKSFLWLMYGNRFSLGERVILNWRFRFRGPGKLVIGDNVNLWTHKEYNEFLTFTEEAVITIGAGTRINGACMQCHKNISVGKNCLVGSALIIDSDFHSIDPVHRNDSNFIKTIPVVIDDNVWLAGQCAILKGVTIGEGSTVGFRAVVTKDVPPRVVVAGNPARIIKHLDA